MTKLKGTIICIPVHKIDKSMKTFEKLEGVDFISTKVAVFCDKGQKELFKNHCAGIYNLEIIEGYEGINRWQKRQFILDYVKEHKYKYMIMMDDDLTSIKKRDSLQHKLKSKSQIEIKSLFKALITLLKDGATVSSTVAQFAHLVKGCNVYNMRRPTPLCAYDMEKIVDKANDIKFRNVELEDICFWYELIDRGLLIQCLSNVQTRFSYSPVVDTTKDEKDRENQNEILQRQLDEINANFNVQKVVSYMRKYKPKIAYNEKAYKTLEEE